MLTAIGSPHLVVSAVFLITCGTIMVYSASALRAELLFGSSSVYLLRQLAGLALGTAAAFAVARVPSEWLRRTGIPFWALTCVLLAATLSPLGLMENGASRWLAIGPLSFQPLELAKLGVVLALAQWLANHESRMQDVRVSIGVPALITALPAAMLLLQPDYGGAMLIVLFAGALVFAAGARLDHLAACGAIVLPALGSLALVRGYRLSRLEAFVDPWADPFGQGYQLIQSLLAFGAGGIVGTGLGAGQQKLGYLPEAHTDFILSVVGEELGLLGVSAVLIFFALAGVASLAVASRARNTHTLLLATGGGLLIWLQGLINAGVALGVLPTTGATLPLFSYGRTSLVVSMIALALVFSAARPSRGRSGWRA
jgi:cell division protein FtsW